ncbi:MAG: hypothetical protein CSA11_05005 [Chloroflexi bacterium]|nr:MAG: hypothetical protein CSA11_05005 [Chloroflexota bacterium]
MKAILKIFSSFVAFGLLAWVLTLTPTAKEQNGNAQRGQSGFSSATANDDFSITVGKPVTPTLTQAVRDLPPPTIEPTLDREINPRMSLSLGNTNYNPALGPDPLLSVQADAANRALDAFDTPLFNFDGQGYTGVNPPDTVGDIGKDHYIQMVNGGGTVVSIYDKTDGSLIQSFALTSLSNCTSGNGDPVVLYDQQADRWFLSEFGNGYSLCILISQTPDPTGAYYSYQFNTPNFPDYPKYGVWPDAYYATTNEDNPSVYAFDRSAMLTGAAASSQYFTTSRLAGFGFQSLTPSDMDGSTPPPNNAPNYIMRHVDTEAHGISGYPTNDILEIWGFSVDWNTPANSSFTKVADILTTEFDSALCGLTSFNCMGMPGVSQGSPDSLDPLREVIMNRLIYRNFDDYETLVGNFTVDIGNDIGGVRWFELRKVGTGGWTLYQEGTYAPTTNDNRWMGSIAMDGSGNIALGYNVSSQTVYPSLRYAGRLNSDALGTMPQGEYTLVDGSGVNSNNRYGDYSAMSIDPVDDCTFWFTGQWNETNNWSTRIGAFKFDTCGKNDFTLAADPAIQNICVGSDAIYDVTVWQILNYNDPVSLSVTGEPANTMIDFSVNPVTPPGNSQLTISNTAAATAGSFTLEIAGIAPTSTHTTTVGLNVFDSVPPTTTLQTPANGATNIPVSPTFTWSNISAVSYLLEVATDTEFTNIVYTATVDSTSHTVGTALDNNMTYFWRILGSNSCGDGYYSDVFTFVTMPLPGDCGLGSEPNVVYEYGFENGESGWSSSGTEDTWTLAQSNPYSGTWHYFGNNVGFVSDQQLASPAVVLPVGDLPLTLDFWHTPNMEDGMGTCFDGGILEISNDGGTTWTQVPEEDILENGYTGTISTNWGNPLGGEDAWCGVNSYINTIVDVSAYAGDTVQFRMRLGTDSSYGAPGWDIDNVTVQSCVESVVSSIALTKTVGTDPNVNPMTDVITVTNGTMVTYFYEVANTGGVTYSLHTLEDSQLGTVLGPDFSYELAPGATTMITASVAITETVTGTAVWTATDGGTHTATSTDSTTVYAYIGDLFLPIIMKP